jgi:hypothetical protein
MKLNTVKSLFEFRDNTFEGVYENLISSAGIIPIILGQL